MSERGKYFKLPEGYTPSDISITERTPREQKQQKQDAISKPSDAPALAPTISAQMVNIPQPEKAIEETRKSIGCGAIAAMCIGLAASGAVGTLGYFYINKKPPFDAETAASSTAQTADGADSPDGSENIPNPEIPEKIYNNEDLKQALKASNIKATAKDFEFEGTRPELQAKAVFLVPLQGTKDSPAKGGYQWKPVRERITRMDSTQTEVLVAVRVVNQYIGNDDVYNLVVPEGLSYRAKALDPNDRRIMYFYYNCEDKKGQDALLAQLGIKDPEHPKKLMWARSFMLPVCE